MAYEASSVTLSKKLSNGHHSSFAGASVYDGVFSSPPKKLGSAAANLSSRAEDYSEIFGGGGDSSFAVRLEELSLEPNTRKKSEKEW